MSAGKVRRTRHKSKRNVVTNKSPHTSFSPNNIPSTTMPSFTSDVEDEIMAFMDQLDCGIISSTPLNSHSFIKMGSFINSSLPPITLSPAADTDPHISSKIQNTPLQSCSLSILQTPSNKSHYLSLTKWGLPEQVVTQYNSNGIKEMFQWQAECLSLPNVLTGHNIVYSAPTSAGKTLVAELLSLKCILEHQKKVLIVLPFVSIVHEKVNYLRKMFEQVGIKIGGFVGNQSPQGGLAGIDMGICTIEKANSLVNHIIEEDILNQIGLVVVDELHMVGDRHRGYLIELLLTKLLHASKKLALKQKESNKEGAGLVKGGLQLVGMSATLPNLEVLAKWLDAALYCTDYRPVPLKEMVKIGNKLYDNDFKEISELSLKENFDNEDDHIIDMCEQRLLNNQSVLIFCPTKAWCEKLCLNLAKLCSTKLTQSSHANQLFSICEQLCRTQVGIDSVLAQTVPIGVAFHHAGLTLEEREIIEEGFRQSLIRILVATSTLSSGVNLPAHLVIIRTPIFQKSLLDPLVYRQMIGRAGRKGINDRGESVLICKPSEHSKVVSLLKSKPKEIRSCLYASLSGEGADVRALYRAVLEVIVNSVVISYGDIILYLSCTLLCAQLINDGDISNDKDTKLKYLLNKSLEFLLDNEFVQNRDNLLDEKDRKYNSTQLGVATVASSLSPTDALIVLKEFSQARKSLVLENELHLIYLVTPVTIVDQWPTIDWYKYLCIWEKLPADMKHVANVVGVKESFIVRALQMKPPEKTEIQKQKLLIHQRFYTSLVLHDLIKEKPIANVSQEYGANKGLLQSLQLSAGTFAGMVTVFCNKLGWKNMEILLAQFQCRLVFGIERELCDIVKISLLNGFRARVLYNSGYHTLNEIATASPSAIESVFRKAFPFVSSKCVDENKMTINWSSRMRRGMSEMEAAVIIVQEAQKILCEEMNVPLNVFEDKNGFVKIDQDYIHPVTTPTNDFLRNLRKVANKQNTKVIDVSPKRLKLDANQNVPSPVSSKPDDPVRKADNTSSIDLFTPETTSNVEQANTNDVPKDDKPFCDVLFDDDISKSLNDMSLHYTSYCTESGLSVIDLSSNISLLQSFVTECSKQDVLSFSVAVETTHSNKDIGASVINKPSKSNGLVVAMTNEQVMGVAFNFGSERIYYLSLCQCVDEVSHDDNIVGGCPTIPLSVRIKVIQDLLSKPHKCKLVAIDVKKHIKYLMSLCHVTVTCQTCDPLVADWLINPDSQEKTLSSLISNYLIEKPVTTEGNMSLSTVVSHSPFHYLRAAAESVLSYLLMNTMETILRAENLYNSFSDVEMPTVSILAKLEINGIGFSFENCFKLRDELQQHLVQLEQEAYKLAGRKFVLSSPHDTGRVLFHELELPSFQNCEITFSKKTKGQRVQHLSTSKEILEKISSFHPLPKVIIEWRRITNTISKTIYPLIKSSVVHSKWFNSTRIHCSCEVHTSTGRISITDPNLQSVPKEYSLSCYNNTGSTTTSLDRTICIRNIFTSFAGGIFLAADYSQLELRILAHMSGDEKLCQFLNKDGDAFRLIAAEWLDMKPTDIKDTQRQQTKQLCYGMIYGIGVKTLAEQLGVSEDEAAQFMESFKSKYPKVREFIITTINSCRQNGYITTICNRRRYLPEIRSTDIKCRSQAERQAVNSTIQGSAADLAKKSMINIDNILMTSNFVTYISQSVVSNEKQTALLVLQLHDELVYEVHESCLGICAEIVKHEMESVLPLKVKLPVKLSVGKSWGQLESYKVDVK